MRRSRSQCWTLQPSVALRRSCNFAPGSEQEQDGDALRSSQPPYRLRHYCTGVRDFRQGTTGPGQRAVRKTQGIFDPSIDPFVRPHRMLTDPMTAASLTLGEADQEPGYGMHVWQYLSGPPLNVLLHCFLCVNSSFLSRFSWIQESDILSMAQDAASPAAKVSGTSPVL